MSYFETREHALLGERYEKLYVMPTDVCRGITRNIMRCTEDKLLCAGLPLAPSHFNDTAYLLTQPQYKAGRHPYHHAGAYYVQEPSAAAPAQLLCVQRGDIVLDMCAAPGGKSAQLAAALEGTGLLISNEYVYARALILSGNIERMGFTNTVITCASSQQLANALPQYFDKILVDAPCSGEGMFRKEAAAVTQHSEALVHSCAALGAEILDNAAICLKPGGLLVYSTCTFAPEEDEGQIGAFLARHTDFRLAPCNAEYGCAGEQARAMGYDYDTALTRRIYPCHGGEGHFMAKLEKCGDIKQSICAIPKGKAPAKPCQDFLQAYFPTLAHGVCTQINDKTLLSQYALPRMAQVQTISAGVSLGEEVKGRFIPSHALFMAYGQDCTNIERLTLQDERTQAYLRGEEIAAISAANGYCAVLIDDMPLGFGKVSGGKCKNHYPKGLRNLK